MPLTELKFTITRGQLSASMDKRVLERADAIIADDKIMFMEANILQKGRCLELMGEVMGSGVLSYTQEVKVALSSKDNLTLTANCTCPVGKLCKHGMALLLNYIDGNVEASAESPEAVAEKAAQAMNQIQESRQESDLEHWFGRLNKSVLHSDQRTVQTVEPGNDIIVYILSGEIATSYFSQDFPTNLLTIEVYRTRKLLKGGFGKLRPATFSELSGMQLYRHEQREDEEICKLISLSAATRHYRQKVGVRGPLVEKLVERLVTSQRCFWEHNDKPPLAQAEARDIHFQWQHKDENAKLTWHVEPGVNHLLHQPMQYVDEKTNTIGPVNCQGIADDTVYTLLNTPEMSTKLARKISRQWLQNLHSLPLVPPDPTLRLEEVSDLDCQPIITLQADTQHSLGFAVKLDFQYGPHLVSTKDEAIIVENDDGIQRIKRDFATENNHQQYLLDSALLTQANTVNAEMAHNLYYIVGENQDQCYANWDQLINQQLQALEQQGWQVTVDESFTLEFYNIDEPWQMDVEESEWDWFSMSLNIKVGDNQVELASILLALLEQWGNWQNVLQQLDSEPQLFVKLDDNKVLRLDAQKLRPALVLCYNLLEEYGVQDDQSIRMPRALANEVNFFEQTLGHLQWQSMGKIRALAQKLADFSGIENAPVPKQFTGKLRSYQQTGLNWLQFLRQYEFSGILADDMGLGKTVQALTHLALEQEAGRLTHPALIVVPTSLIGNWQHEAKQFCPELKVLLLYGHQRQNLYDEIAKHDLVITTYSLIPRDEEVLLKQPFHTVLLDEAQKIKNPRTKAANTLRQLNADHRLCLTGTPLENNLTELWSLFEFLMPGFLGQLKRFNQLYRNPIEKHGDREQQEHLNRRIMPFMLRRSKEVVAGELPPKTEINHFITLDSKQAELYETLRVTMEKRVLDVIKEKGLARSHITVLDALLKLRQVCCDPALVKLSAAREVDESAKLSALLELVTTLLEEGRKILVFSQFTSMLDIIEAAIQKEDITYSKLTGKTRKRQEVIDEFRSGASDLFLISLKAGGVGLNLVEADTVIHYDPWWNPAVQDQATDRAHRIGQDKPVFVYKLIASQTVEEKILEMQEKKRAIAQAVYKDNDEEQDFQLDHADLQALFEPMT